jgi:methyl-accepting chemotaxis protein
LNRWFSIGIDYLSNNPEAIWIASGLIIAFAFLGYWIWFRPHAVRLQRTLVQLARSLEGGAAEGWSTAKDHARIAVRAHAHVAAAWNETEERVIPLPHAQRTLFVMFGAPRDLWSANRLLGRSMNLPLAEAVPNLLVGVGLLFTFLFLTLALTEATTALLPSKDGAGAADLTSATRGLLSAAGAKFLTSLTGLLASIVWTIGFRRRMARLSRAADTVLDRIGRIVPSGGGEMAMFAQLQASRDMHQAAIGHADISKQVSEKTGRHVELSEELLGEAREQTGTFKRFETDLAVSLAGAITTAFSPQMEAMTDKLTAAIDGLSLKIGTMNQEALRHMMDDFAAMLKKSTDSEMAQLRETLVTLAERLTGAGNAIGEGAGHAAEKLDKAGADLLTRVEQVSANLASGATNLEGATQGIKEAMNDLDVSIRDAADLGKKGSIFVRGALDNAEQVFGRLQSATEEINAAGAALERVSGRLSEAVDGVEEMTREQRSVVNAVREATPNAMASIQRVLDLLQQTVQSTATMMNQTRDSMATTSKTLGTTVAEITAGVSEYSRMVAELHRRMDEELAKAVGSLDKGVVGLEEAIEELGEVLSNRLPRG